MWSSKTKTDFAPTKSGTINEYLKFQNPKFMAKNKNKWACPLPSQMTTIK